MLSLNTTSTQNRGHHSSVALEKWCPPSRGTSGGSCRARPCFSGAVWSLRTPRVLWITRYRGTWDQFKEGGIDRGLKSVNIELETHTLSPSQAQKERSPWDRAFVWKRWSLEMAKRHRVGSADRWLSSPCCVPITRAGGAETSEGDPWNTSVSLALLTSRALQFDFPPLWDLAQIVLGLWVFPDVLSLQGDRGTPGCNWYASEPRARGI